MSLSASFLDSLSPLGLNDPLVLTAVSVAVGLVVTSCFMPRRRGPAGPKFPAVPAPTGGEVKPRSGQERRRAVRRSGPPTPLFFTDIEVTGEETPAWVLDRSTGGLGLLLTSPLAPDTVINVRSADAPEDQPWVPMQVRHCRPVPGGFQVGSQFLHRQPWSVLLLFG